MRPHHHRAIARLRALSPHAETSVAAATSRDRQPRAARRRPVLAPTPRGPSATRSPQVRVFVTLLDSSASLRFLRRSSARFIDSTMRVRKMPRRGIVLNMNESGTARLVFRRDRAAFVVSAALATFLSLSAFRCNTSLGKLHYEN